MYLVIWFDDAGHNQFIRFSAYNIAMLAVRAMNGSLYIQESGHEAYRIL